MQAFLLTAVLILYVPACFLLGIVWGRLEQPRESPGAQRWDAGDGPIIDGEWREIADRKIVGGAGRIGTGSR